jgi:hypothetical protein
LWRTKIDWPLTWSNQQSEFQSLIGPAQTQSKPIDYGPRRQIPIPKGKAQTYKGHSEAAESTKKRE